MLGLITRALVPPYRASKQPSKPVAIVVPMSMRSQLSAEEQISLNHLLRHLGRYDKFLIAPPGVEYGFDTADFAIKRVSKKFFGSMRAYSRMLYWPGFYRQFEDYEYILIYHLDALVFRDELLDWCATGVDYIGAPFMPCPDSPGVPEPKVGNGGFSLMKIESTLKVLHERYRQTPVRYWQDQLADVINFVQKVLRRPRRLTPAWLRNSMTQPIRAKLQQMDEIEVTAVNNDLFWSYHAQEYVPEFKIPDWKTGLRFAFEVCPRHCFELNQGKLPFGCHAWPKYDRSFWEPYLLRDAQDTAPRMREAVSV
jgi:hypothetical protein